jgi:hypothetical protein
MSVPSWQLLSLPVTMGPTNPPTFEQQFCRGMATTYAGPDINCIHSKRMQQVKGKNIDNQRHIQILISAKHRVRALELCHSAGI